uniref:calcitonin gene-related peptide type 1 receptor-like n=1 Tax=Myxine glutinosa TaxID=7769 RepID=UPI00358F44B1
MRMTPSLFAASLFTMLQIVYIQVGQASNVKILLAQYDCYMNIIQTTSHSNNSDTFCKRTWDGWMCWGDTEAGVIALQNCPDYFLDFDTAEKVTKICNKDGHWFRHPESNRTWSNYTSCNNFTAQRQQMTLNMYYLAIAGNSISILSLTLSLIIFFYFKNLSCQRITLHKNLFSSFLLTSIATIVELIAVAHNEALVSSNPVGCKVLQFVLHYLRGSNYFWMLCEGIHLHTLIVVAVFAEEQQLLWYYLLGWGFPLIPALIHAVARTIYFNDNCWISSDTKLMYVVHGPVVTALVVNLFFVLNIVRVLVTKLKDTHHAESHMYMKAARATLILVPLLGIQFVLVPWRPEDRDAGDIYMSIMNIFTHYQGLLVATLFCFFNGEVQMVLKRHWLQSQHRTRTSKDSCRSPSCTATSISDMPSLGMHHCNGGHINGNAYEEVSFHE